MKRVLFYFFILALMGCYNSEEKGDVNECISLLRTAESCNQEPLNLPCGLRFGMNRKELESHLENLTKNNNSGLKKKGNQYIYMFKANSKLYECNIIGHPSSQNPFDTIAPINEYSFVFDNTSVSFKGDKEILFEDMKSEYKDFDFSYCQFDYTRNEKRNKMWHDYHFSEKVYCWTYQSLAIILSDHQVLSIVFYNAPITKPSGHLRHINESIKEIGEEEKREKVRRYKEKKFY